MAVRLVALFLCTLFTTAFTGDQPNLLQPPEPAPKRGKQPTEVADKEAAKARPASEPPSQADKSDPLAGVIGFQPLFLASSSSCSACGKKLKAGTEAYVGVRDAPGPRVLIGPECLPKPEDEGSS